MEKQSSFIFPLFMRWLKKNNIYELFRINIKEYPSNTYTLDKWLNIINTNNYISHLKLVTDIPFEWTSQAEPKTYSIRTLKGADMWAYISREWKEYVNELVDMGYYEQNVKKNTII